MTANDSFDRRLGGWLVEEAQGRVSDHLAEVLVATRATRQRPGWASLERWLPVTSIALARPFRLRPALPILLVLALLVAALTAFVLFQAGRPAVPKLGEATNGRIVYVDGSSVLSVAADGSDPQTIATTTRPGQPVVSPDGDLVAYIVDEDHVEIAPVTPPDGPSRTPITVIAQGMAKYALPTWSPDGMRVAFIAADTTSDHAFVADRDGRNVHQVGAAAIAPGYGIGWLGFSPDGRWLAIADGIGEGPNGQLQLVSLADGSFRKLDTPSISFDDGAAIEWSPNPATPRILYLSKAGATRYYDVATDKDVAVAGGFWPSWSPTGDRISYWSNGTKIIATPTASGGTGERIEVFPSFGDSCGDHPEYAGKAICGPVTWSPDGLRVVGTELLGHGLLSLRSDGKGDPILLDLRVDVNPGAGNLVSWQPRLKQ